MVRLVAYVSRFTVGTKICEPGDCELDRVEFPKVIRRHAHWEFDAGEASALRASDPEPECYAFSVDEHHRLGVLKERRFNPVQVPTIGPSRRIREEGGDKNGIVRIGSARVRHGSNGRLVTGGIILGRKVPDRVPVEVG